MSDKVVFGSLFGAVAVLLMIAVFRPSPEPRAVEEAEEAVATAEAEAETEAEAEAEAQDASPDSDEGTEMSEAVEAEAAEPAPETPDQVAELTARIEELEAQLLAITEQAAQSATSEDLAAIQSRVDEVAEDLGAQAADLSARLGAVQEQVVEAVQAAAAAPETPEPEATQPEAEATAVAPAPESGLGVGQTALLADGALRVFVSRVTEGQARLSINGRMVSLDTGARHILPVGNSYCGVTLDGASAGAAQLSALCGDALPAPEGTGVGQTVQLADGALRVFVSRVTDTGARLSINGERADVALGGSVRVDGTPEPCRIALDAIDRGHVQISALCGAEAGVTAPVGPGATAVLADGAVRVFVSSVSEDAVRFAVNGQSVQSADAGSDIALDDGCTLSVTEVMDGAASFGLSCE